MGTTYSAKTLKEIKDLAVRAKDYYYNRSKNLKVPESELSDPALELLLLGYLSGGRVKMRPGAGVKVPSRIEITDSVFDVLETALKENGITLTVRAPSANEKVEVELPYPMPSLNKCRAGEGTVAKYSAKNKGPYLVSPKMDGISLEIVFRPGEPVRVFTGTEVHRGKDVSFLAQHLNLPKFKSSKTLAIRCEGILSKAAFAQFSDKYKAARNLASGVFNKKGKHEAIAHVDLVVYEVLEPRGVPSTQLAELKARGFTVVPFKTVDTLSDSVLSSVLNKWRETTKHEIDGVVVTVDRKTTVQTSDYSSIGIAFKEETANSVADTQVVRVEWNPSKDGLLKPRVEIKPVKVGGVTITWATGKNAKFIVANGLGPGAQVTIARQGDVIPDIVAVNKKVPPQLPDKTEFGKYDWDKNKVEFVLRDGSKVENIIEVKRIYAFLAKGLGVEHLAEATIARCYAVGMKKITDYLRATPKDFMKASGVQSVSAQKFYDQIQNACSRADENKVAAYSGYFGRNFGSKRMALITAKYPLSQFASITPAKVRQLVLNIEGFQDVLATQFAENIHEFLKARISWPIQYLEARKATGNSFDGQQVVFTGFRDATLEAFVTDNGGIVGSGVSGKTTILVVKDSAFTSAKVDAARAKGVKVLTAAEFRNKFKIKG